MNGFAISDGDETLGSYESMVDFRFPVPFTIKSRKIRQLIDESCIHKCKVMGVHEIEYKLATIIGCFEPFSSIAPVAFSPT